MGVFRDGNDSRCESKNISEDAIRRAIAQSGSDLTDKLAKLIGAIPGGQIITKIINGNVSEDTDAFDSSATMEKLAESMLVQRNENQSNFKDLGDIKETSKNIEDVNKTIDLLANVE